jgi:tetratricopeptide (TPR) repeat protein
MLVGRASELAALEAARAAVASGSGRTVLVTGDAGIGKTQLVSELAARSRTAGFEVLLGRAIDFAGTELPYQPLRPLGPLEGATQLGVFENALSMLADRSDAAPVLLVVEDLHWADASTLDLVVFLAHNLETRRIALVATYRADEPASAARIARLRPGGPAGGRADAPRDRARGDGDAPRAALLHETLGRYLYASGRGDAALDAFERSVALAAAAPTSRARAEALASHANGLLLASRYRESLPACQEAPAAARAAGHRAAELRALTVLGTDLAYLGRGDEGLAQLRLAVRLALEHGDRVGCGARTSTSPTR